MAFATEGTRIARALEPHLPTNVTGHLDELYDLADRDALLDVFHPTTSDHVAPALPTIVWVHGGGFVAGSKDEIANYLRILSGRGFAVVGVDYALVLGARYPTPVRQMNAALAFLTANAARLRVDPAQLFLAGDSGGAHIAAQVANLVSVPAYAAALDITPANTRSPLAGGLLFCGPHMLEGLNLDGPFGGFLRTVLWSYTGTKDFLSDPRLARFSVVHHVTAAFPRTFISVGNADPLAPHLHALAAVLMSHGVPVDALFFPDDHAPALPHEFQFNLATEAGRLALERSIAFLSSRLSSLKSRRRDRRKAPIPRAARRLDRLSPPAVREPNTRICRRLPGKE